MHNDQVFSHQCRFIENKFPDGYIPTIFDNQVKVLKVNGFNINLSLWYELSNEGTLLDKKLIVNCDP